MFIVFYFLLGVLSIFYGVYSYIQRKVAPEKTKTLQSLIERNGEKIRHSTQLIAYTRVPIVADLLLWFAHFLS